MAYSNRGLRNAVSASCLGLFALVVLPVACKVDNTPTNEADFCAEYAKRECTAVADTCSRDITTCEPIRTTACTTFLAPYAAVTRTLNSDNVKACLDQVTAVYADQKVTPAEFQMLTSKCARVMEGTAAANDACVADQDCTSPLICDKGRCGTPQTVAAGGNCANPGEICDGDQICAPSAGLYLCTPKQGSGASCSATAPCVAALRCAGTCMAKVANGGACATADDCTSGYCDLYPPAGMAATCLTGLNFAAFSPSCNAFFGAASTTVTPDASTGG